MNKIGFVFKSNIITGNNISNDNTNKIENNIITTNVQQTNNDSKELAVAYLRVSTKEQEDEGYSLDNQERKAEEYAEKQNLEIVKTWKGSESAWRKVDGKISDVIDRMLPSGLSEYFFFDGESMIADLRSKVVTLQPN